MSLKGIERADFVQEIFFKVWQALQKKQYDRKKAKFRTWLKKICLNHWRDHCRKADNRLVQAADPQLAELPAPPDDFQQQYDILLIHAAYKLIRPELSAKDQKLFTEIVFRGRPVREVAAELGLSAEVVSAHKYRILLRLKQELGELAD